MIPYKSSFEIVDISLMDILERQREGRAGISGLVAVLLAFEILDALDGCIKGQV